MVFRAPPRELKGHTPVLERSYSSPRYSDVLYTNSTRGTDFWEIVSENVRALAAHASVGAEKKMLKKIAEKKTENPRALAALESVGARAVSNIARANRY